MNFSKSMLLIKNETFSENIDWKELTTCVTDRCKVVKKDNYFIGIPGSSMYTLLWFGSRVKQQIPALELDVSHAYQCLARVR